MSLARQILPAFQQRLIQNMAHVFTIVPLEKIARDANFGDAAQARDFLSGMVCCTCSSSIILTRLNAETSMQILRIKMQIWCRSSTTIQ
jgi:hypothetical protein